MKYLISWEPNISIVTFNGDIRIQDIELANKDIHGDNRTYKTSASIWNFSDSNTNNISPEDLGYTEVVDIGSTSTIKIFKLAIVANDPYSIKLFKSYINNSIKYGSPWEFKIFSSLHGVNEWINA
jgi:hypothetical protein